MKIGFLFPGQGSQTIGMGADLYEKYETVKQVYESIKKITGMDIVKLTASDELNQTQNTQICILTMSLAILEILKQKGIKPYAECGLSLGEYSALIDSGAISFEDGVKIVQKRGYYMQTLSPKGDWQMAAVLGLEPEKVKSICQNTQGFVAAVNYNCPGQIVISGEKEAVEKAGETAKNEGARKVIPLKTSGPFHTEKLNEAANALEKELEKIEIHEFKTKVMKNIDGSVYSENDDVRQILTKHITSPVQFEKCLQNMTQDGVDTFVEIGPGKTLSGFVKKVKPDATILYVNNVETLENAIETLGKNT